MDIDADLRIGELADLAGVSTRMIRHYHHAGVLPEPVRASNGYRCYRVRDVVLLLRVRQLVEMGLNLDEVRDALAAAGGDELREILAQLDADLAIHQKTIADRRARIATLLARTENATGSGDKEAMLVELERVAGRGHPALGRERLVADLLEVSVDPALTPSLWQTYREVLSDEGSSQALLDAEQRFDALAGLDPQDPTVDSLAATIGSLGDAVQALLPAEVRVSAGDPVVADRLLRTVQAGMDPAQAHCLALVFARWQERSS